MPPVEPQPAMEQTKYGWAIASKTMPRRGEGDLWLKLPERHIYMLEYDMGWYRVDPPEHHFIEIKHG